MFLFLLLLATLIGLLTFSGRAIFIWLRLFSPINPRGFGLLYAFLVLVVLAAFVASRFSHSSVPRIILRIAHYGLGALLYLVMIVGFVGLIILLARLARLLPSPLPRAIVAWAGAICLAAIVGLNLYGSLNATLIRTQRYTVQLGNGQPGVDAIQITLVSDLHLGYVIEEDHLAKVVAAINKTQPELVCLAGDIFDGDITALAAPDRLQALLGSIKAELGVYACLGNHDAGPHYEQMLEFLAGAGIRVLLDEAVVIDNRLLLAGRRDASPIGGQGAARAALATYIEPQDLPVIVIDHQPGSSAEYEEATDLVLAGHTHKGQMFPFNLITKAVYLVDYGYHAAEDGPQFIVTSGAGTWGPPLRVASNNEIVVIQVLLPKR